MKDCVWVKRRADAESFVLSGVHMTQESGIDVQKAGFSKAGKLCLRIPETLWCELVPGDLVQPEGCAGWYTVTLVRKNIVPNSPLSHYKVVAKE